METTCRLTEYSQAGGCGCKIDPATLSEILSKVPKQWNHPDLMVGIENSDDAAVLRLDDRRALVFSSDFSSPIVDDPYAYGQISAANAISDIYAMGGTPVLANAIVGFPVHKLQMEIMQDIMQGAVDVCKRALLPLAGGHSIDNPQPIFGLSVVGLVQTDRVKTNASAEPGDVLIMTKPLGIGILSSAIKTKIITPACYEKFVRYATQLNTPGAWLGQQDGVHGLTDITGFGLAGHLLEMAKGAGVHIEIDTNSVPVIEDAWSLVREGVVPGAAYRNMHSYGESIEFADKWNIDDQLVFTDPQTNGGLLVSVEAKVAAACVAKLTELGFAETSIIGRVVARNGSKKAVTFSRRDESASAKTAEPVKSASPLALVR